MVAKLCMVIWIVFAASVFTALYAVTGAADLIGEMLLKVGEIHREQVHRIRVEQIEKFEIDISNYCAIIAGGSPFDVTCPDDKKSVVQKKIESFFNECP